MKKVYRVTVVEEIEREYEVYAKDEEIAEILAKMRAEKGINPERKETNNRVKECVIVRRYFVKAAYRDEYTVVDAQYNEVIATCAELHQAEKIATLMNDNLGGETQ